MTRAQHGYIPAPYGMLFIPEKRQAEKEAAVMEHRVFTIKQIADLFGNTKGAIRFYQEKGLVAPEIAPNGYRYYSIDDFFQLLYLKRFASMSLSLDEVALDFRRESRSGVGDLEAILAGKSCTLRDRIEELRRQLDALEAYRQQLRDAQSDDGAASIVFARECWALPGESVPVLAADDPATLEKLVSLIPITVVGGRLGLDVGSGNAVSGLKIPASVAIDNGLVFGEPFYTLPAGLMVTKVARARSSHLGEDLRAESTNLAAFAARRGYATAGDVFTEPILVHVEDDELVEYHVLSIYLQNMENM